MTNDSKAQKGSRNSRLVERYGSAAVFASAFVFDAIWWESIFVYAEKSAYVDRVQQVLDAIEDQGLSEFPSVFEKTLRARKTISKTKRLAADRAFKRNR